MNKIYAIRFADGSWAQGSSWKSTSKIEGAKLYGKRGTANQAMSYHDRSDRWKTAQVIEIECYPGGDELIETLKKFYQVETLPELIKIQSNHIERLQEEVRKYKPKPDMGYFGRVRAA